MTQYFRDERQWEEDAATQRLEALARSRPAKGCLFLLRPLRPLLVLLVGRTLPALVGRVGALHQQERAQAAIELAVSGAERFRTRDPGMYFTRAEAFWLLVRLAVDVARASPMQDWSVIIDAVTRPVEPVDGIEAARALHYVSRHLEERGDTDAARTFARLSLNADPSWPESRIWAAWLGMRGGAFDTAALLREAIALDPRTRSKLRDDPAFGGYAKLGSILEEDAEGPLVGFAKET